MMSPASLWFRLVPAYALGYFLSYALRSVIAVIAPELMRELDMTAAGLPDGQLQGVQPVVQR